jgi:hypothetical protein
VEYVPESLDICMDKMGSVIVDLINELDVSNRLELRLFINDFALICYAAGFAYGKGNLSMTKEDWKELANKDKKLCTVVDLMKSKFGIHSNLSSF